MLRCYFILHLHMPRKASFIPANLRGFSLLSVILASIDKDTEVLLIEIEEHNYAFEVCASR